MYSNKKSTRFNLNNFGGKKYKTVRTKQIPFHTTFVLLSEFQLEKFNNRKVSVSDKILERYYKIGSTCIFYLTVALYHYCSNFVHQIVSQVLLS